ncbi:MAG: septum formation protein Maf [Gammaproteobacteria bacterium]|nr:MAG: septum formation protein Maf [Gammaproteobacteria bacterium]
MNLSLILASKSSRRRELLAQLGYQFSCENADVDEGILTAEKPKDYVQRVAIEKTQAIFEKITASNNANNRIILAADTSVVVDDVILGKPIDFVDFKRMFQLLSNRDHQVLTAIVVCKNGQIKSTVVVTKVFFKPITDNEMAAYWQSGEPQDKAGGYGIQGLAGQFISHIQGSYSAVVGLPLYETVQLLSEFGLKNPMLLSCRSSSKARSTTSDKTNTNDEQNIRSVQ